MILSNTAIFDALDDGRLVISPEPQPRLRTLGGPPSPFGTTSVDLKLGPYLQVPAKDLSVLIDLRKPTRVANTISRLSDAIAIDLDQGYRLEPENFVLGHTAEKVKLLLPTDFPEPAAGRPVLAARVEGKSSRARFGLLVHFTAPTIHAGFEGQITLEIMCLGPNPIVLYPGMDICQLIIEQVVGVPSESQSQFHNQTMPSGTR